MIWALRRLSVTKDFFNAAQGQRYYEPISRAHLEHRPGLVFPFVPGKRGQDVFFLAEFGLALEHTTLRTLFHGKGVPFLGKFAYHHDAQGPLLRALRGRSKFLADLFGADIEKRLEDFDANAPKAVEGGLRRGFVGGAFAAWKGEAPGSPAQT